MAFQSNILNIPLNGTGTEIPTLNVTDPYEKYLITGANTTIGNYAIIPTGTPQLGTTFLFKYKATTDITTNGNTFTIFGQALTQNQLLIELDIECYYTGSAWIVEVKPSLTTAFVEAVNIVAGAIGSTQLANLSVTTGKLVNNSATNAKLAQMADQTVKANVSGALADPSDVALSTLVALGGWGLTGNAGTTAGTNFIGTTDNIDVVFKRGGLESGRISGTVFNTSFGRNSLISITSGASNTAIGNGNSGSITSGDFNTSVGGSALINLTSGDNNTAIGAIAEQLLTTGSRNTIIGASANVDSVSALNRIALGYNAEPTADYQFAIPDDVTTIKFKGLTYTLPTALPGADAILHCSSTGVLTWV